MLIEGRLAVREKHKKMQCIKSTNRLPLTPPQLPEKKKKKKKKKKGGILKKKKNWNQNYNFEQIYQSNVHVLRTRQNIWMFILEGLSLPGPRRTMPTHWRDILYKV